LGTEARTTIAKEARVLGASPLNFDDGLGDVNEVASVGSQC